MTTWLLVVRPGFLLRCAWVLSATGWWLFNKPLEGPILLPITEDSGITLADVVPVICMVVVARYRRRNAAR
ncbi:hypothetical protein NOCA2170081 [metagenome]|uniref:Uncharacterized protein n=1 Tax=metagenome TaxID=256318 RepID=A0A2P2BXN0_9ZZZZ